MPWRSGWRRCVRVAVPPRLHPVPVHPCLRLAHRVGALQSRRWCLASPASGPRDSPVGGCLCAPGENTGGAPLGGAAAACADVGSHYAAQPPAAHDTYVASDPRSPLRRPPATPAPLLLMTSALGADVWLGRLHAMWMLRWLQLCGVKDRCGDDVMYILPGPVCCCCHYLGYERGTSV